LWTGVRSLAAVADDAAALIHADGAEVAAMETILDGLVAAARADSLVLDGFITKQTAHSSDAVVWPEDMPSIGRLVGLRRNRALDTVALIEEALEAHTFEPEDDISFVAVDLLWLDDTSLLDVPLLERRRLLDSVVVESDDIRIGPFVRAPIEPWVNSWRTQGFNGLTYKAANSRYLPGESNPEWVVTGMPRR
jgi:hypothetical protein